MSNFIAVVICDLLHLGAKKEKEKRLLILFSTCWLIISAGA